MRTMKTTLLLPVLFGAALLLQTGCTGPLDYPWETECPTPRQGEQRVQDTIVVEVPYGREVVLQHEQLAVKLVEVPDDSRCPVDAVCVWEGNARVVLTLQKLPHEKLTRAELNTHPDFPRSVEFGGYDITLEQLVPLPVSGTPTDPEDYRATLRIVRK